MSALARNYLQDPSIQLFFFLECLENPYKGLLAVSDSHTSQSVPGFGVIKEKCLRNTGLDKDV